MELRSIEEAYDFVVGPIDGVRVRIGQARCDARDNEKCGDEIGAADRIAVQRRGDELGRPARCVVGLCLVLDARLLGGLFVQVHDQRDSEARLGLRVLVTVGE